MNAVQFIQQHGIEKAREVVECSPKNAELFHTNTYIKNAHSEGRTDHFARWSDGFKGWVNASADREFIDESIALEELKRLVDSVDLVNQLDFWGRTDVGIKKAKEVIGNNTLQASYYQPSSGFYYRYGHNSLYIVRDGEWKEIYGGMDSNTLIHTDRLKQAIADYESIYGGEHV